uniref:Uncharacterized protein n=1 Tax=Spermophilus dauricus TaxID=99837 RepID=A0A8C9P8Q3_SPEDA
MVSSTTMSLEFHYETKWAQLDKASALPLSYSPSPMDPQVFLKVKSEIEEKLKSLDKEISEVFTSTGFDHHISPVFSPANPESSIQRTALSILEKALQELREPLHKALQILLTICIRGKNGEKNKIKNKSIKKIFMSSSTGLATFVLQVKFYWNIEKIHFYCVVGV